MLVHDRLGSSLVRLGLDLVELTSVLLHLHVKPNLVSRSHVFVLLLLLDRECAPTLSENVSHFHELDVGKLRHDLRAHFEREKDEGSSCSFRCFGVLHRFSGSFVELGVNKIAMRVVSRRRDVDRDPSIVPGFVFVRFLRPHSLFFRGQLFVLLRRVLRKLTESESRILALVMISHGVLKNQISGHVSFRCCGISVDFWSLSRRLSLNGQNRVALSIVTWGRNVA